MKKLLSIAMLLVLSLSAYAQKEVTKFLGIPVDGTKSAMIRKLKAKGFTLTPISTDRNALEGEFNGRKVNVYVATNNDKVYRIMVADADLSNESEIKIRFNNLCQQFAQNPKYIPASLDDFQLSEDEDISYEMAVNSKRYQAAYYQMPTAMDTIAAREKILAPLLAKYTKEELANPTDEMTKELTLATMSYLADESSMRSVWFMISELYGKYYILMYYDNRYNEANGQDL